MALGSIYRSTALDHQARREPIDGLADVTVPYDWLILALLAAVCAAVVAWGALGRVERSLHADAVIVAPDDRRAVVAPAAGRVAEVLVDSGDRVDGGQPLARVSVHELDRRLAAARERERIILAELPGGAPGMREMLIEARAEAAALAAAIAHDSVIASPFAGEVIEHRLSPGAIVAAGEEVARVRVGPPSAPAALASLPRSRAAGVQPGARARLHCGGTGERSVIETRVAEVFQAPMAPPAPGAGEDLDPNGQWVRLLLPDAASVAEGDRCELHIAVDARAPLQYLLAATR